MNDKINGHEHDKGQGEQKPKRVIVRQVMNIANVMAGMPPKLVYLEVVDEKPRVVAEIEYRAGDAEALLTAARDFLVFVQESIDVMAAQAEQAAARIARVPPGSRLAPGPR